MHQVINTWNKTIKQNPRKSPEKHLKKKTNILRKKLKRNELSENIEEIIAATYFYEFYHSNTTIFCKQTKEISTIYNLARPPDCSL